MLLVARAISHSFAALTCEILFLPLEHNNNNNNNNNRQKKTTEKTMKYAPLRWELKQKYHGYKISQYNIIVDVLGGWSTDVEVAMKQLVGRRHKDILKKMQMECLSVTLNIARTFKVPTH